MFDYKLKFHKALEIWNGEERGGGGVSEKYLRLNIDD
jgi:hypothetical protein